MYNLGWLAWFGLVPLFIAISGRSSAYAFFSSFAFGIIFFALTFNWVFEVPSYKLIHHVALGLYLGPFFGIFGFAFNLISRRCNFTLALFSAPFLWVSLEYIKSNMGFLAFPYAWLGYTQHKYPQIIQIASVTGTYGVSFLVVMVNSALAALVFSLMYRSKTINPFPYQTISKHAVLSIVSTAAVLTIITLYYGIMTISTPIVGKKIKVSIVQGNIEQAKKWDKKYVRLIMKTYTDLSKKASEEKPALIVWPEAATPGFVLKKIDLLKEMISLARQTKTYYLIGSSEYPKFEKTPLNRRKMGNTALLFSPEGRVLGQYLKIRLLPFNEYLPYSDTINWSWIDVPNVSTTLPGKKFTVFQGPDFRFSAPICWENIFPELPREFVKNGAQFLVNITNEAWFGRSVGPQHYVISSIFRAVENRVFVVRCANTGISCFIDPYGRVVDRVKNEKNQDIFISGVLTETVIPMDSKTIYTRYGDWLVWLCIGCSVIFMIIAFFKKMPGLNSQI
jgi:apolipoprotein N-acyltransferase